MLQKDMLNPEYFKLSGGIIYQLRLLFQKWWLNTGDTADITTPFSSLKARETLPSKSSKSGPSMFFFIHQKGMNEAGIIRSHRRSMKVQCREQKKPPRSYILGRGRFLTPEGPHYFKSWTCSSQPVGAGNICKQITHLSSPKLALTSDLDLYRIIRVKWSIQLWALGRGTWESREWSEKSSLKK